MLGSASLGDLPEDLKEAQESVSQAAHYACEYCQLVDSVPKKWKVIPKRLRWESRLLRRNLQRQVGPAREAFDRVSRELAAVRAGDDPRFAASVGSHLCAHEAALEFAETTERLTRWPRLPLSPIPGEDWGYHALASGIASIDLKEMKLALSFEVERAAQRREAEAAKLEGAGGQEDIHAWHRRGWIPCLRAGRRPVLFDLADVEQALRERAKTRQGVDHE